MSTLIAMAPCGLARPLVPLLQSAALLFAAGAALSAPVSISTPFMNLENRNINSLGFSTNLPKLRTLTGLFKIFWNKRK